MRLGSSLDGGRMEEVELLWSTTLPRKPPTARLARLAALLALAPLVLRCLLRRASSTGRPLSEPHPG